MIPNVSVNGHTAFSYLDMIAWELKPNMYHRETAQHNGTANHPIHRKGNVRHHVTCVRLSVSSALLTNQSQPCESKDHKGDSRRFGHSRDWKPASRRAKENRI
jgi:hypothetical protein